MPEPSRSGTVHTLLDRHGRTWAGEAGSAVRDSPSSLFTLLCLSLLLSGRIDHRTATSAARALFRQRWTSPAAMAEATWADRTGVLNRAGYARYDESTSRMLGATSEMVADRWKGDLRRWRSEADRQPEEERRLLQLGKGIGPVGANIFCREVQGVWEELCPFADERARRAARRLGLGDDPAGLARACPPGRMPELVAALVPVDLEQAVDA